MASRLGIIRTLTQESWFNLIWCINALKCCIFFWNLCVTNWAWPNQGQSHKLPLIPEIKRNLFWIFQLLLAKSSFSLKANFWIKGFGFIKNKSISIDSINLYLYSKSPHKQTLKSFWGWWIGSNFRIFNWKYNFMMHSRRNIFKFWCYLCFLQSKYCVYFRRLFPEFW